MSTGFYDTRKMGIDGVTIELLAEAGTIVAAAVTDAGGMDLFEAEGSTLLSVQDHTSPGCNYSTIHRGIFSSGMATRSRR